MQVRFEDCVLDLDRRQLLVAGDDVPVEPQVYDVLAHLVVHRDRLVDKTELLDEVWGDRFVSESALTSRIKSARRAIGDDGATQRLIRTRRGHGYQFVGDVEVLEPRPSDGAVPVVLAALRTELVGRGGDLAAVERLLDDYRVATISGPGGAGKSTLALAVAHRQSERRTGGAVFAELAPARDHATMVRTVAEAAGVQGVGAASLGDLATALGSRDLLLVVDNCEHLLDACAELVDAVLDAGADVTVLATSREPLRVAGEAVHPLGSLGTDATRLFAERARAATGAAAPALDDPRVLELCERLDGLPLAIELAAAQLGHLTLDDLVDRLDDRLGILAGGRPRAGARHSALAATVEWSYDLLDPVPRDLFQRLGVFPASFDLEASQALTPDLDRVTTTITMADLVAKNLVVHDRSRGRYHLLETIRLYAAQRLAETGRTDEVLEFLRGFVVRRATTEPRHRTWLSASTAAASHADIDNVRVAFDASVRGGHLGDAVDVALAIATLWRNATSYAEGLRWASTLHACVLSPRDQLWVHVLDADLGLGSGDPRMLLSSATAARALAAELDDPAASVIATIYSSLNVSDPRPAIEGLELARDTAHDLGEPGLERLARAFLLVARLLGGGRAELDGEVAELTGASTPDGYDRYISLWASWVIALSDRDGPALRHWMDLQLDNVRRSGNRRNWLMSFCHALTRIGEGAEWADQLRRARRRARDEGRPTGADSVLALAYEQACRGEYVRAAELLGASRRGLEFDTANFVHHLVIRDLVVSRELDALSYSAALERGRADSVADVLAEHGL